MPMAVLTPEVLRGWPVSGGLLVGLWLLEAFLAHVTVGTLIFQVVSQ